jgi:hypothetical protein
MAEFCGFDHELPFRPRRKQTGQRIDRLLPSQPILCFEDGAMKRQSPLSGVLNLPDSGQSLPVVYLA